MKTFVLGFILMAFLFGQAAHSGESSPIVMICRIAQIGLEKIPDLLRDAPLLCTETKAQPVKTIGLSPGILKKMKGQVFLVASGAQARVEGLKEVVARICAEEWTLFHKAPKGDPLPDTRAVKVNAELVKQLDLARVFIPMTCESRTVHK